MHASSLVSTVVDSVETSDETSVCIPYTLGPRIYKVNCKATVYILADLLPAFELHVMDDFHRSCHGHGANV